MRLRTTIAETPYEQHRDYVLAVLASRCAWLDASDREAAFHDAYAVLLEKEQVGELQSSSMHPRQVRAYLTLTAVRKAFDEGKRAGRKRVVPLVDDALAEPDMSPSPQERVAADMDSAPVREIVAELSERRQSIVKLRFYFDRTPEEIQRFLKISERVYRRELERAIRQIAERYELVRAGQWCETRRSPVLAYVAGIAGPRRAREARAHLASCPVCAHLAAELREAARRVAATLPLPALALDDGPLPRLTEFVAAARDTLVDLGAGAKQQGLQVATRLDPGSAHYVAGARPGAVAATVASCVAAATGATYCVVAEVPEPIRRIAQPVQSFVAQERKRDERRGERAQQRKRERKEMARNAQPPAQPPPPVAAAPVPTPQPQSTPAPTKPAPRRQPASRTSPRKSEFGFESASGSARAAQASPPQASSPAAKPPPSSPSRSSSPRRTSEPPTGAPGVFEAGP